MAIIQTELRPFSFQPVVQCESSANTADLGDASIATSHFMSRKEPLAKIITIVRNRVLEIPCSPYSAEQKIMS